MKNENGLTSSQILQGRNFQIRDNFIENIYSGPIVLQFLNL